MVFPSAFKLTRRADDTFDWTSNAGANLIIDVLGQAGIECGYCTPATAGKFKVVLASLTSTYDVYNMIWNVAERRSWAPGRRSFVSIVGGFGVQNVTPLRHFFDYAAYGRAEGYVVGLVRAALGGSRTWQHPSVLTFACGLHSVRLGQASECYPRELATKPIPYREVEIGCPRKCYFCHYSWARRHNKTHNKSFAGGWGWDSPELLFDKILTDSDRRNRIRTALDGFSERLRAAFNKPNSNEFVRDTVRRLSLEWQGKSVWLLLYMIGSYPTETDADRQEFEDLIFGLDVPGKMVSFTLHVSPFRPSPLTPAQWLPANLDFNWNAWANKKIIKSDRLRAGYALFQEGPYPHLMSMVVERAIETTDPLISAICFSHRLASMSNADRVRAIQTQFDLDPYLREYKIGERLPTWYVESYTPTATLERLGRKLKKALGLGGETP